jgi:hypothetical protein
MNVSQFIAELRKELVRIDEAILAIEKLGAEHRKAGRPPGLRIVGRGAQGRVQKAAQAGSGQI